MSTPQNEKAPDLVQKSNALNLSHIADESATAARMFRDRLAAALLPLETELLQHRIQHAEAEARSEALLTSEAIADRHREWKAAHPSFDPLFEAIRTNKEGRSAR